jgi:hypothetical protein
MWGWWRATRKLDVLTTHKTHVHTKKLNGDNGGEVKEDDVKVC